MVFKNPAHGEGVGMFFMYGFHTHSSEDVYFEI